MRSSTCLNPKSQHELYGYSVSKTETGGGKGSQRNTESEINNEP